MSEEGEKREFKCKICIAFTDCIAQGDFRYGHVLHFSATIKCRCAHFLTHHDGSPAFNFDEKDIKIFNFQNFKNGCKMLRINLETETIKQFSSEKINLWLSSTQLTAAINYEQESFQLFNSLRRLTLVVAASSSHRRVLSLRFISTRGYQQHIQEQ